MVEGVFLALLAAGTFAAAWLIPWPKPTPRTPTTSVLSLERAKELKRKAGRAVEGLERAEPGEGGR